MFSLISLPGSSKAKLKNVVTGAFASILGVSLFDIVSSSTYANSDLLKSLATKFAYGSLYRSGDLISLGLYTYLAVYAIYLAWLISAVRAVVSIPIQDIISAELIGKVKSNVFILFALLCILITPMLDPAGLKIYGSHPHYLSFKSTQILFLTLSVCALMDLVIVFRANIRK